MEDKCVLSQCNAAAFDCPVKSSFTGKKINFGIVLVVSNVTVLDSIKLYFSMS